MMFQFTAAVQCCLNPDATLISLSVTESMTNCSCPEVSQVEVWAKFILEEVSIPVVGSVGLLGNLAAIVVLSHPDMKSTFHQSLISLAIFEILFLILLICDHAMDIGSELYIVMFPYFLFPLKNIMMSCESYLLMSIALERLIAVVRPLWYRNARLRLSSWYHASVFILPTVIISVSLNIPQFLVLKVVLGEGGSLALPGSFPMAARAATSKAETAVLTEALALVST